MLKNQKQSAISKPAGQEHWACEAKAWHGALLDDKVRSDHYLSEIEALGWCAQNDSCFRRSARLARACAYHDDNVLDLETRSQARLSARPHACWHRASSAPASARECKADLWVHGICVSVCLTLLSTPPL